MVTKALVVRLEAKPGMARADELLAAPPDLQPADVLAAKLP
jgi:hypothetical protein